MRESKSGICDRLRREGCWEQASLFKDAEIGRLRATGVRRREASAAAWEALAERFPPLPEGVSRPMWDFATRAVGEWAEKHAVVLTDEARTELIMGLATLADEELLSY